MNRQFIHEDFLLDTNTARLLFHTYASDLPILDFHSHLDPQHIAEDKKWDNLAQISLEGDHYKWRAMRAHGVSEKYITGTASDHEKFLSWARTVPYTLRNPLYHWTHMELKRYFNISSLLNEDTAKQTFDQTASLLSHDEYSAINILKRSKVEVLCTTDDPIDSLEYHQLINNGNHDLKVLPTWRPDSIMHAENPKQFNQYLDKLEKLTDIHINTIQKLLEALSQRHDYFAEKGCSVADQGIDEFYTDDYSQGEINDIFSKLRSGNKVEENEIRKYKSFLLYELALMNHEKAWVQQYHFGALRNTNTRMFTKLGRDAGFDSMGDQSVALSLSRFLDRLDQDDRLSKTILYNINPKDNDMLATMTGNFQSGNPAGKIQFGPGWWFLDQKEGMENQLNSLSNYGLLNHFVGMLTDSRSFLSFIRHEYFRRILCNMLGHDVEKGLIPDDIEMVGGMVQNICYDNAKRYFNF